LNTRGPLRIVVHDRRKRELDSRETAEDVMEVGPPPASDDFFRQVNDRIVELGERFGYREEVLQLICECGDTSCSEHLSVPAAEYEEIRNAPGRHVVAAGHVSSDRVVARGDGYVVVED
jgi:hypothetical protein